ncbi:MAG: alpha-glucuronidase [Clostridia bacterium]|nr:alpha-glucuronidase [Clostridia bacterium]
MPDRDLTITPDTYSEYDAWMQARLLPVAGRNDECLGRVVVHGSDRVVLRAADELVRGLESATGTRPVCTSGAPVSSGGIHIMTLGPDAQLPDGVGSEAAAGLRREGFRICRADAGGALLVIGADPNGTLYGVFRLLRLLACGSAIDDMDRIENPVSALRMINHWDNLDGSIERGYAGRSIFFENDRFIRDLGRARDYARLLASVGINTVSINNVNVRGAAVRLITEDFLPDVARLAEVFRDYGIRLMLCVNFTSPILVGGLGTADPLDPAVIRFWTEQTALVYRYVPDLRGFLVKADSEFLPGPAADGRTHADGADTIARALHPFGGIVVWRCFVYNCMQDWRDTRTDRPKAAYENFMPLDGDFDDNVLLQIKNGPVDFQIREPVSPLFGALRRTREVMELQITQEYTGQQKHLCYLVPLWKEIFDFDMGNPEHPGTVGSMITDGTVEGIAGVVNVGLDRNWTGHTLAQANLFGYARLCWDPQLGSGEIADEWIRLTLGSDPEVVLTVRAMLLSSRSTYEKYNAPLGIGWMCNPSYHYGPNVDGYEYAYWGTYHRADHEAIGVDRTRRPGGTAFTAQYPEPTAALFDSPETCPEELLLFFHRLPYSYRLRSGSTLLQHIYDTHFEGVEEVGDMIRAWQAIKGRLHPDAFGPVAERLDTQFRDACEWRDVINTYFYRKTGIADRKGRKIHT